MRLDRRPDEVEEELRRKLEGNDQQQQSDRQADDRPDPSDARQHQPEPIARSPGAAVPDQPDDQRGDRRQQRNNKADQQATERDDA